MRVFRVLLILFVAACGGGEAPGGSEPRGASATAGDILTALKQRVPTITETIVYDASTDPNSQLGRPGQYTSKSGFYDSRIPADAVTDTQPFPVRRGGSVEVFESGEGAEARADYVGAIVNQPGNPFGAEYLYRSDNVLLRVSGMLTPAQASDYEKAFRAVVG